MGRSAKGFSLLIALSLAVSGGARATSEAGSTLEEVDRTYRSLSADCSLEGRPFGLRIIIDASVDADAVAQLLHRVTPPSIACSDPILSTSLDFASSVAGIDQKTWLLITVYAGGLPRSIMDAETIVAVVRDHVSLTEAPDTGVILPLRYGNPVALLRCPGDCVQISSPSPALVDERRVFCRSDRHDKRRIVILGLNRFSSLEGTDRILIDKRAYVALENQFREEMKRYSGLLQH